MPARAKARLLANFCHPTTLAPQNQMRTAAPHMGDGRHRSGRRRVSSSCCRPSAGPGRRRLPGWPCRSRPPCPTSAGRRTSCFRPRRRPSVRRRSCGTCGRRLGGCRRTAYRLSLIHISEPTRLLSISYAVFCLKKKKRKHKKRQNLIITQQKKKHTKKTEKIQ